MKTEIQIQQKNLNNLLELMKENPELKVIPMVDSDIVASDDYSWWSGNFGTAEIDEYYSIEERIYFRSWDEEELIDNLMDNDDFIKETGYLDDNLQNIIAQQKINNLPWEKVIVLKITCN